jgi:hypothetical protein
MTLLRAEAGRLKGTQLLCETAVGFGCWYTTYYFRMLLRSILKSLVLQRVCTATNFIKIRTSYSFLGLREPTLPGYPYYSQTRPKDRNSNPDTYVKGMVSRDFSPLFFLVKQLLPVTVGMPIKDSEFFRIFAEVFDSSGASLVSTILAM